MSCNTHHSSFSSLLSDLTSDIHTVWRWTRSLQADRRTRLCCNKRLPRLHRGVAVVTTRAAQTQNITAGAARTIQCLHYSLNRGTDINTQTLSTHTQRERLLIYIISSITVWGLRESILIIYTLINLSSTDNLAVTLTGSLRLQCERQRFTEESNVDKGLLQKPSRYLKVMSLTLISSSSRPRSRTQHHHSFIPLWLLKVFLCVSDEPNLLPSAQRLKVKNLLTDAATKTHGDTQTSNVCQSVSLTVSVRNNNT